MTRRLDLNCDLGEGAGQDAALMRWITTASVACGGHAGDENSMRETVRLARDRGVAVGAHPGYEDPANFGRIEISITPEAVYALVRRQILALRKIAEAEGVVLSHVKPHGALYNDAARDEATAGAVVAAVKEAGSELALFALSGSALAKVGAAHGLRVASEVFADRAYRADGSLVPRAQPGAVHEDEDVMVAQVLDLVLRGALRLRSGEVVAVRADTLCLHGDGAHAVPFARKIRQALSEAGVEVAAFAQR